MQTFHRPTVTPSGQKKGVLSRAAGKALSLGLHFTTAPGKDNVRGEPVYIETSEKQEQEAVLTFNLGTYYNVVTRIIFKTVLDVVVRAQAKFMFSYDDFVTSVHC